MNRHASRIVGVVLALLLSGAFEPVSLLAQSTAPPAQNQNQPADQNAGGTSVSNPQSTDGQTQDQGRQQQEDKATQQMINSTPENNTTLPESPDAIRARQAAQNAQSASQKPSQPTGTAAAQEGQIAGSIASRPAGAALAPAKQRRVRSFLIKLGAIAGAGVALGTVFALSRASGPKPPGAH